MVGGKNPKTTELGDSDARARARRGMKQPRQPKAQLLEPLRLFFRNGTCMGDKPVAFFKMLPAHIFRVAELRLLYDAHMVVSKRF